MIWAEYKGHRISAVPKIRASCPICKSKVISRCGQIKKWHWAHFNVTDCDTFSEPETDWHLNWKDIFPKQMQEVIVQKPSDVNIVSHRADIMTKEGTVLEFQNSPLSTTEIQKREEFYGNLIWILNGETIGKGLVIRDKQTYVSFRWKSPPKSWWFAKKKIYIDLSHISDTPYLLLVKKIYSKIPCGGWGILIKKEDFINGHHT